MNDTTGWCQNASVTEPQREVAFSPPIVSSLSEAKDLDGKRIKIFSFYGSSWAPTSTLRQRRTFVRSATSFAKGNIVCAMRKSARVILEQATRRDSSLRSRMTVGGWGSEGSRALWNQCVALYGICRRQHGIKVKPCIFPDRPEAGPYVFASHLAKSKGLFCRDRRLDGPFCAKRNVSFIPIPPPQAVPLPLHKGGVVCAKRTLVTSSSLGLTLHYGEAIPRRREFEGRVRRPRREAYLHTLSRWAAKNKSHYN